MDKAFNRALIARQAVLCAGALGLVWLRSELQAGLLLLGIVGVCGVLNLAVWLSSRIPELARISRLVSPVVGLLGWGALALFTRGVESPFVAGFFFEIGLSAVAVGTAGVLWATIAAIIVLSAVQSLFGPLTGDLIFFEIGFLAAFGGLAYAIARRRVSGETAFRQQEHELGQRLEILQRELEDERVVARVGENVARLAHGLKNAVHSLRGFVGLIEPHLQGEPASNAALAGLRAAIDDLEGLARMTLADNTSSEGSGQKDVAPSPRAPRPAARARVEDVLEEAHKEMARANPGVAWEVLRPEPPMETWVELGRTTLLELLIILMRNAVEAMDGEGRARIELERREGRCCLSVRDEGVGFDPEVASQIFQPGYTTKQKGSGFGLFLARRIVQDHGGDLTIAAGSEKGAIVRVEIPIADSPDVRS
jgi:signal transduction histidine kinase